MAPSADPLEELVGSLLREGYALYPYTPGATKNATPTPFGIVYAPADADGRTAHDHLRMEVLARTEPAGARIDAEVRFLESTGERHRARERRVRLRRSATIAAGALRGTATLAVTPREDGLAHVALEVRNATPGPRNASRAEALRRALLSTHVVLRVTGGTFVSPLEADGCRSVNTWPVLAADDDTAVLGAAIVLPEHPRLAPESRGDLFDGTEIEEALLIHLHALSDGEREEIGRGDPAVLAMVERAVATAPEDLLRLHGRLELREPGGP